MSAQRSIIQTAEHIDPRYADLRDRWLAASLSIEDRTELDGLDPLERTTCWTHRRWLHRCVSTPLHVIVVTAIGGAGTARAR